MIEYKNTCLLTHIDWLAFEVKKSIIYKTLTS